MEAAPEQENRKEPWEPAYDYSGTEVCFVKAEQVIKGDRGGDGVGRVFE